MENYAQFHISISVPCSLITPRTLALTASSGGVATTYHLHFPGNADGDCPGESQVINSPSSTHFSYRGMDVTFPTAVGHMSCKKTCEQTQVLQLTTSAAQINWHFWSCLL